MQRKVKVKENEREQRIEVVVDQDVAKINKSVVSV